MCFFGSLLYTKTIKNFTDSFFAIKGAEQFDIRTGTQVIGFSVGFEEFENKYAEGPICYEIGGTVKVVCALSNICDGLAVAFLFELV